MNHILEQDFRRVLKMWMAVSGWWWCRCRNYSFPVGGAVVHHHHGHGARLHSATRSTFSPHRQLRRATAGRTGSDEISTENFLYSSFLSLRESATVEMRDSVQSVEFRRDERPKLLPRFLGKERPSFAKSDLGLGTWGRNSMSASLFHFEQAASGWSMSPPPGTCKYL